jgi:GNAT superfamily N-acetyltransferase
MRIRKATRQDIPDIIRLLSDDPLGNQREQYQQPLPQEYYDAFHEIDRDKNNQLIVLETNGEVVGTLQLTFIPYLTFQGGKRAQIEAVRIDRRFRNQGLGQKIIEWAISKAREQNCHLVQLTTNKHRTEAHRFYERFGFAASHEGMKLYLKTSLADHDSESDKDIQRQESRNNEIRNIHDLTDL